MSIWNSSEGDVTLTFFTWYSLLWELGVTWTVHSFKLLKFSVFQGVLANCPKVLNVFFLKLGFEGIGKYAITVNNIFSTSLIYSLCRLEKSYKEIFVPLKLPADNERSQGELHFDVFSIIRPRSCSNLQMANSQKFVDKK